MMLWLRMLQELSDMMVKIMSSNFPWMVGSLQNKCELEEQLCSSGAFFPQIFLQNRTLNCFNLLIDYSSTSLPVLGIQACVIISKLASMGSLVCSISATATSGLSQELLRSTGSSGVRGSVDAVSSASEREELKCP